MQYKVMIDYQHITIVINDTLHISITQSGMTGHFFVYTLGSDDGVFYNECFETAFNHFKSLCYKHA